VDKVLLISVTLPLLERGIVFQSTGHFSIFFFPKGFYKDLSSKEEPKGRPKYVSISDDTLHGKMSTSATRFGTWPTETNSYLPRFMFNQEISLKSHKNAFQVLYLV